MNERSPAGGFTLIELIVVVAILGMIITAVVFKMENMSPKYRLRSAVRDVASMVEYARAQSVRRGWVYGIGYDRQARTLFIVLPDELKDEDGQMEAAAGQLADGRSYLEPEELPADVYFHQIMGGTNEAIEGDPVVIDFDPMGNTGSHIVTLQLKEPDQRLDQALTMSFKFQGTTGVASYHQGEVSFATADGR